MGPVRKKFIYCNNYTQNSYNGILKNNLCVNRYAVLSINSKNDKLALLNTTYNQTFKYFML